MKLKDILLEGYAWERKEGQPLPTLAEVQAEYQRNEAADAVKAKVAKLEKEIADLKHQYYKDSNLSPEREKQLRKQMGEKGRELKRAKREDKTGSEGYGKPSKSGTSEPRWQDSDGDGNWYEPGEDVKEGVEDEMSADVDMDALNMPNIDDNEETDINESFWKRVNGNLHGHEHILRESFRK
jgi:hypothetical protein